MLILQIILIVLGILLLFAVFLPNTFELLFVNDSWKISIKNIFFSHSLGEKETSDAQAQSPVDTHENKNEKKEPKPEKKIEKPISSKTSPKKEECREKENKDNSNVSKEIEKDEIPEFTEEEGSEKSLEEWLEFAKKTWDNENKLLKSLLKFFGKTVKLSLKLLTPAKIEINAAGGRDDPAETGWLCSVFILFNSYFEKNKRISLSFSPQFYEPKWEINGNIRYVVSIAKLLLFVFMILIYIPYLQILACVWRNRKVIFSRSSASGKRRK
jgi:hypothetical protein